MMTYCSTEISGIMKTSDYKTIATKSADSGMKSIYHLGAEEKRFLEMCTLVIKIRYYEQLDFMAVERLLNLKIRNCE